MLLLARWHGESMRASERRKDCKFRVGIPCVCDCACSKCDFFDVHFFAVFPKVRAIVLIYSNRLLANMIEATYHNIQEAM